MRAARCGLPRSALFSLVALILVALTLVAGCEGSPEAGTRATHGEEHEPTAAPEPDEEDEPTSEPVAEPPVTRCGIQNTTRQQRRGCSSDRDCTLRAIDFATCLEDGCGRATHPYNCAFAARVSEECGDSDCDLGSGASSGRELPCGRGGSARMHARCVDGLCEERVAPSLPQSRLIRVSGALAERQVQVALRRALRTIEACFPAGGDDEPVVLRLDVSGAGAVTAATVTVGGDGDASLIGCVTEAASAVTFPESTDGEPVQVLHRFARRASRSTCEDG